VIRAVMVATLTVALLAGCRDGSSSRQSVTNADLPTVMKDSAWSAFESDVATFEGALSQWREAAAECLAGPAAKACIAHLCRKLGLDYDAFRISVNGWLERPRLSAACHAKALNVVTHLIQRYAMLTTAAFNRTFGTADVSRMVDTANVLAEKEAQSLAHARNLCASRVGLSH
jgi:hypothetical protein